MGFLPFFLAFDHTKISTYSYPKKKASHDAHRQKIHKRRTSKGGVYEKLSSWHGYSDKRFSSFVWLFEVHIFVPSPFCPLQLRQTSCFIIGKLLLKRRKANNRWPFGEEWRYFLHHFSAGKINNEMCAMRFSIFLFFLKLFWNEWGICEEDQFHLLEVTWK